MKFLILVLGMLLFTPIPSVGAPLLYTLHLKNGGVFVTPYYWGEDHYWVFQIAGGFMGVEKSSVRAIDFSTIERAETRTILEPGKPAAATPVETKPVNAADVPQTNAEANKDPAILNEYRTLEKKFQSRNSLSVEELKSLKDDLTVLREKIVTDRLKYDFLDEVNKIADMRFFVNDLILMKSKSR